MHDRINVWLAGGCVIFVMFILGLEVGAAKNKPTPPEFTERTHLLGDGTKCVILSNKDRAMLSCNWSRK